MASLFCVDTPHKADEASDPSKLAMQIEALQSQIDNMRPALEAMQEDAPGAPSNAEADSEEVDPTRPPTVTINKQRKSAKVGKKKAPPRTIATSRSSKTSGLFAYVSDAALTEPSHDFHTVRSLARVNAPTTRDSSHA